MTDQAASKNFSFLSAYDPLIDAYGFRAECDVYTDPNTSLIKTRQLGELLTKSTAAHQGMDCRSSTFEQTIGLLRRQGIVPSEVAFLMNNIRIDGNRAAHEHARGSMEALQCLMCAYELSKWFAINVLEKELELGPFRPPAKPENVTAELEKELQLLREDAARYQLESDATDTEVEKLSAQLEREAKSHQLTREELKTKESDHEATLECLQQASDRRLKALIPVANASILRSFVARSTASAKRIGKRGDDSHLPLTQLRIATGGTSRCCSEDLIVVQSMGGGFMTQNCANCNKKDSGLSQGEFEALHVYVKCGDCGGHAQAAMVGKNYGYRCECGWECELAALVTHYTDNQASR